jgi:hypothetical protein
MNRSRPSKSRWTARMSKHTAAPAVENGGGGTGDRRHQGWPELQGPCACRRILPPVGVIIITPRNVADCTVGPERVSLMDGIKRLLGDKAYDSNSFRKLFREDGIKPVIPAPRKSQETHPS